MSDKEDNANDQVAEELPPSNKLGDFLNESENPFSYHDRSNHQSSDDDHEHQIIHGQQTSKTKASQQQPSTKSEQKIETPLNINQIKPQQKEENAIKESAQSKKVQVCANGFQKNRKEHSPPKAQTNEQQKVQKVQKQKVQYQREMEDDLMDLKKSIQQKNKNKFHTAHKQKQSKKQRLNKTMVPQKNPFDEEDSQQVRAMEVKMLLKMSQEKKKENYQLLKEWDKRRAQNLALHRNLVQMLQNEIDKRIKSSIENLEIYTTFFKEKAQQQQKYANQPIINTRYALQNNSLSKNVYINCSVILNALSDENMQRCKKINDLVLILKNDIIRDLIQTHLNQSQRELLRIRQKISTLKSSLRKYNAETEQKTNELAIFFNQNSVNLNLNSDKDFYRTQLSFLRKAGQQTHVQKKLGQYCLEYYHSAINQQIKRSKVIRQAMLTYSKGLKQSYSIDIDPAEIEQLSKAQQNKLIEQFYCLEELFDGRTVTLFKAHHNMKEEEQFSIDNFTKYINSFQFQSFNCRIILLKQFKVSYMHTSKSNAKNKESCYLVITVDNFVHLFFSKQKTETYAKPDVTFKAGQKNIELKIVKNETLDVIIKDQKRPSMISYFWETKNDRIYRLQFQKKDSRQEFLDYINKLIG